MLSTPLPPGARCSTKWLQVESPSLTTVNSHPGDRTADEVHTTVVSIGGCKRSLQSKMRSNIAVRLRSLPKGMLRRAGRGGRTYTTSCPSPAHASSIQSTGMGAKGGEFTYYIAGFESLPVSEPGGFGCNACLDQPSPWYKCCPQESTIEGIFPPPGHLYLTKYSSNGMVLVLM